MHIRKPVWLKLVIRSLLLGLIWFAHTYTAAAQLNVFACEPEWGSLAGELGGSQVRVVSATVATQDPHYVRAKPSLLAAVRQADLIVCTGASLESGWLPLLLEKAGSEQTQPGRLGYFAAAEQVNLLEQPKKIDRAEGDIHPEGNPHLHLNPHNILTIAARLTERLCQLSPSHANGFNQRFSDFTRRWSDAIRKWERDAQGLRDRRIVSHHRSFAYLVDWLGMQSAGTIESKPGIPPSSKHLESLLHTLRSNKPDMIIRSPYDPADASVWLAEKLGIHSVILPYTVGGNDRSTDLFGLFTSSIELLKSAP